MKYKMIERETYAFMINAIIAQFIGIIALLFYLGAVQEERDTLERDLKSTIKLHNDKNHQLNECESKIIQGTCLTRMPSHEELING